MATFHDNMGEGSDAGLEEGADWAKTREANVKTTSGSSVQRIMGFLTFVKRRTSNIEHSTSNIEPQQFGSSMFAIRAV
jgi:hypothetical protein